MLFVRNKDKPGFIGNLGRTLGEAGINIATFHSKTNLNEKYDNTWRVGEAVVKRGGGCWGGAVNCGGWNRGDWCRADCGYGLGMKLG